MNFIYSEFFFVVVVVVFFFRFIVAIFTGWRWIWVRGWGWGWGSPKCFDAKTKAVFSDTKSPRVKMAFIFPFFEGKSANQSPDIYVHLHVSFRKDDGQ